MDHTWSLPQQDGVLRRLNVHDSNAIYALLNTHRSHLRQWMTWVDDVQRPADVRQYIVDSQRVETRGPVSYECGIFVRNEAAGVVGLNRLDWANRSANIGYWLGQSFEGRGLVTQACLRLLTLGFEVLGLARIELRAAAENTRSRAVAKRVGFHQEGILRSAQSLYGRRLDVVVYSLLPQDENIRLH